MNIAEYKKTKGKGNLSILAQKLGVSLQYVSMVLSGRQSISASMCIKFEKATDGQVRCEDLRPDIDWGYLRGTKKNE